jgi:DnaJ-class molecular chaperone
VLEATGNTDEEIKKQYRKLGLSSDKIASEGARRLSVDDKFREIQNAYEKIKTSEMK